MRVFDAGRHGLTPRLGGRRQKSVIHVCRHHDLLKEFGRTLHYGDGRTELGERRFFVTAQEVCLEALRRITPYGENLSGLAGLER